MFTSISVRFSLFISICLSIYLCSYCTSRLPLVLWLMYIGLVGRVFANGPRDLGSIPGRVIPKTLKIVLDTSLLNTQQYKVHIKGKVEQSWEKSSAPPTPPCSSY